MTDQPSRDMRLVFRYKGSARWRATIGACQADGRRRVTFDGPEHLDPIVTNLRPDPAGYRVLGDWLVSRGLATEYAIEA